MTDESNEVDRLRRAFHGLAEEHSPTSGCPDQERLYAAATGEANAEEVWETILHTSICPSCAESWRLAYQLGSGDRSQSRSSPRGRSLRRMGWAVAASVLIALVATPLWRARGPAEQPSTTRAAPSPAIRTLIPEEQVLERSGCVLRWSGSSGAIEYEVLVSTADLEVIAHGRRLVEPRFQVPEAELAGLPPGAALLWRVEAHHSDGSKTSSPTFVHRLE